MRLGLQRLQPPSGRAFFHRKTDVEETPTASATVRTPLPCASIRAAIMRRISRSLALPLGLIGLRMDQDAYFVRTRFN